MASTVLDHVTAGLCLLSMYIIYIYIHDILNSCCIWNVNLRFGFIFAWLTSTGPVIMVFGYFLMPCVCLPSFCVHLVRLFSAFSAFSAFSCFAAFSAFSAFSALSALSAFSAFLAFSAFSAFVVRFRRCRLWGMEIYVLASPLPGSLFDSL